MSERRFFLACVDGPLAGREFLISAAEARLGRTPENDIVVPEHNVSRHHATFRVDAGRLSVRDAGSKNGVHVNGRRVKQAVLSEGDELRVGACSFRVGVETGAGGVPLAKEILEELPELAEQVRRWGPRRIALWGTALAVVAVAAAVSSQRDKGPAVPNARPLAETAPAGPLPADASTAPLRPAGDAELAGLRERAEFALRYDDVAAAVPLLVKIVAARPDDLRARTQLTRAQTRLAQLIRRHYENGVREYEKMYYDAAMNEFRQVIALAAGFDAETARKAEERIRQVREKLAQTR